MLDTQPIAAGTRPMAGDVGTSLASAGVRRNRTVRSASSSAKLAKMIASTRLCTCDAAQAPTSEPTSR